jgi:hypothetical protein
MVTVNLEGDIGAGVAVKHGIDPRSRHDAGDSSK